MKFIHFDSLIKDFNTIGTPHCIATVYSPSLAKLTAAIKLKQL